MRQPCGVLKPLCGKPCTYLFAGIAYYCYHHLVEYVNSQGFQHACQEEKKIADAKGNDIPNLQVFSYNTDSMIGFEPCEKCGKLNPLDMMDGDDLLCPDCKYPNKP